MRTLWIACVLALSLHAESLRERHQAKLSEEHLKQVVCTLGAFHTLKAKEVAYISSPITSGKRLYDYLAAKGFTTIEEAKKDRESFFTHVIQPNIEESEEIGNAIANTIDGVVIAPTAFEKYHQNWGQSAFMSLWLALISSKVTCMVMLDGWQYSSGSTEEFLEAIRAKEERELSIVDARGEPISLEKGVELIQGAVDHIHGGGLRAPAIENVLQELLVTQARAI